MEKYRMREVFVPGGLPRYTYVTRESLSLERRLKVATDNLCKLVTVTGPTKCGKSVLTQQVFPRTDAVWLDGGAVDTDKEVWATIVDQTGVFTDASRSRSRGSQTGIAGGGKVQLGLPGLGIEVGGTPSYSRIKSDGTVERREVTHKSAALRGLRYSKKPLVIDDFHYFERDKQASIVRALKALIFEGHPIIVLAIPHRKYDAVRVEKEMTGRIEQIEIPPWDLSDLEEIPRLGFELLNVRVPDALVKKFAEEALGSPHLMQDFCRQHCEDNGIEQTEAERRTEMDDVSDLFRRVAKNTSKTVFDRLAKGPRQRSDRKKRRFEDGTQGDIYVAVLRAIALSRPGMTTLEYEEIRSSLRRLLRAEDVPSAAEVARVIEKMASVSATDQSSVPVLDWDKDERRLHITDPFFAFFLRWGLP